MKTRDENTKKNCIKIYYLGKRFVDKTTNSIYNRYWIISFVEIRLRKEVNIMKKLLLIVIGALVISACANKDVYFNGSEGSHSGMKFDKDTRHWGVNQ